MGKIFDKKNFDCAEDSTHINEIEMVNCETQIGFTKKHYHKIFFLVLSLFGVFLGLILFVDFIIHKLKILKKKSKNKSYGSMKLFFRILSVLDFDNRMWR